MNEPALVRERGQISLEVQVWSYKGVLAKAKEGGGSWRWWRCLHWGGGGGWEWVRLGMTLWEAGS